MPGWPASRSVHTRPCLFSESLALRCGECKVVLHSSFGLLALTFSRVRISSSLVKGGLGSSLLVRSGGLTLLGVIDPAVSGPTMFSFSSELRLFCFSVEVDRWTGNESLRGLLLVGMLDIRNGIVGGPDEELSDVK
jgi:hypothetical protein